MTIAAAIDDVKYEMNQKLASSHQTNESTWNYELFLASAKGPDHVAGLSFAKTSSGMQAAAIDANRGIRRFLDQKNLDAFFEDLSLQSSGLKTKSGRNRKFSHWHDSPGVEVAVFRPHSAGSNRNRDRRGSW